MLELLQARGKIGVPELARRLEVGERTVRRYAAMLREIGVPVEAEIGRYGGYRLRPGRRLPPMMFTDEEALGLALGLLAARGLRLAGVAPAVEGALAKLERVIPEDVRGRVQALQETVSIAVALPAATARSEALLALSAAADERRMVRLRYRSGRAEETEQEVDPYERWSVEVLLETGVEEVRGRLPPVGLSLERTEGGTLLRCSTWSLGWMARAGRPGVPFRRAGPKRAQGDARATRRGDFRSRQAHGTDLLMNEADTQESSV